MFLRLRHALLIGNYPPAAASVCNRRHDGSCDGGRDNSWRHDSWRDGRRGGGPARRNRGIDGLGRLGRRRVGSELRGKLRRRVRRLCRERLLRRRAGAHGRGDKGLVVGLGRLRKGEISFLHGFLARRLAPVGSVLDVGSLRWRRAGEFLDVGIERVEGRFVFDLAGFRVGLVGVLAFADGLEYAGGVPLGELDLL